MTWIDLEPAAQLLLALIVLLLTFWVASLVTRVQKLDQRVRKLEAQLLGEQPQLEPPTSPP